MWRARRGLLTNVAALYAAGGGGGGAAPTSLSFISWTSSYSGGLVWPAVNPGDLAVLFDTGESSGGATSVTPTGMTKIGEVVTGDFRHISSYKVCTGSEDGTTLTGMDGTFSETKVLALFRGNTAINSVTVVDPEIQGTAGDPTAQVVSASGGTPPLVVLAAWVAGGAISPRTASPAMDAEQDFQNNMPKWVAYKIYNSSPADHTFDMDDESGQNVLHSFALSVA